MAFNMSQMDSALPTSYSAEAYEKLLAHCRGLEAQLSAISATQAQLAAIWDRIIKDGHTIEANKKEIASLKASLEDAEAYGEAKREEQKVLKSQIAELEQDRDLKAPLFQIGVATRARYLETAKKLAMGIPRAQLDSACIERGNAAAHNAMGEVDATLFHGDILSSHDKNSLVVSFAHLYRTTPEDFGLMSKKISHVIDCEATIRTLNVLNEGNRPITQRQQALDLIQYFYHKYDTSSKESFDADEDVEVRLAHLIDLTGEIMEEDRKSKREMKADGSQFRGSPY